MKRLLWDRRHFGISRSSMTFRHKWIGRFKATQDLQLKAGALRVDTQAQAEMHQQKAPQKHQKTLETEWSNRSIAFSLGRFFKMPCNDPPSLHTFDVLQRSKRHQKRGKARKVLQCLSCFFCFSQNPRFRCEASLVHDPGLDDRGRITGRRRSPMCRSFKSTFRESRVFQRRIEKICKMYPKNIG